MDTKLTLTIEKDLIEQAKIYAKSKGRSLSDIVENYFKLLVKQTDDKDQELTPIVKSLQGSIKVPADFDYKETLGDQLGEKYL